MKFLFNSTSCYTLHKSKPLFFSVRHKLCFCLGMIPFHYFPANSIDILFHHAAQYHRSHCLQRGSGKGGNLNLDGGNWFLPGGCPMGNLNISGVVKACTPQQLRCSWGIIKPFWVELCWLTALTLISFRVHGTVLVTFTTTLGQNSIMFFVLITSAFIFFWGPEKYQNYLVNSWYLSSRYVGTDKLWGAHTNP